MVTGIGSVNGSQKMGTTAMGQLNGIPHTQTSPAPEPAKKPSDIRRSNKPIMEKRRRARINNCLNELKTLILDAMKKDPARHSKLEKADILEMTVKHLENLQRQQFVMSQATDPNVMNKFKSGFSECMNEVGRFPGIDPQLKRRLLQHLNNVINGVKTEPHHHPANVPVQVHILPSPPSSPKQDTNQPQQPQQPHLTQITATSNGYFLTSNTGAAVQLIPTKLTNGNIAFVLPQQLPAAATPVPMLVPIPTRTSSTGSAVSSSRDHVTSPYHTPPSPANSYEAMDCKPNFHLYQQQQQHHLQQLQPPTFQQVPMPQPHHHVPQPHHQRAFSPSTPLSLVMRKSCDADMQVDDDKPWRPW